MCAVPKMAVFCTSLISCFPHVPQVFSEWLRTTAPVSLIITGTTFVFTFYMRSISIVSPSYCKIFSAFLNHVSISRDCLTYSFFIMADYNVRLICRVVLSFFNFYSWPIWLFLIFSYMITPCVPHLVLPLFPRIWYLSCLFTFSSFASIGHADIMWYTVSSYCWYRLFVCLFSWRHNPLCLYFPQPGSGP